MGLDFLTGIFIGLVIGAVIIGANNITKRRKKYPKDKPQAYYSDRR